MFFCSPWNCAIDTGCGLTGSACDDPALLAELVQNEQFVPLDLDQLEQDEQFCSSPPHQQQPDITGLCGVDEITIRSTKAAI